MGVEVVTSKAVMAGAQVVGRGGRGSCGKK